MTGAWWGPCVGVSSRLLDHRRARAPCSTEQWPGRADRLLPSFVRLDAGELDIATVPHLEDKFDHLRLSKSQRCDGELGLILGSQAVEPLIEITGVRARLPIIDG